MSDEQCFVDSLNAVQAACDVLAHCDGPLALDCEGVNLGRSGRLTLLQVSVPGHAFVFDVQEIGGEPLFGAGFGLKHLLEDMNRLKVCFDCRRDCDVLAQHFGIRVAGIFDLQIADIILRNDDEMEQLQRLRGFIHGGSIRGQPQNYENVVKLRGLGEVLKEFRFDGKEKLSNAEHLAWGERPLTPTLKEYAFKDVIDIRRLFEAMSTHAGFDENMAKMCTASTRFADKLPPG